MPGSVCCVYELGLCVRVMSVAAGLNQALCTTSLLKRTGHVADPPCNLKVLAVEFVKVVGLFYSNHDF